MTTLHHIRDPFFTVPLLLLSIIILFTGCDTEPRQAHQTDESSPPEVLITGAMKRVMWEGKLDGLIRFDTLSDRQGLYGIGPLVGLRGEITIDDGKVYVSRVTSDSTMVVEESTASSAPFFVRAKVNDWKSIPLPPEVKTIQQLEAFLVKQVENRPDPLPFKLTGEIERAVIHVQNLPPGTPVSSPAEAHQGQVDYTLGAERVRIIGFYSQKHQGVFTHHDSYLHLHLITEDENWMGHLDEVSFKDVQLLLPAGQ